MALSFQDVGFRICNIFLLTPIILTFFRIILGIVSNDREQMFGPTTAATTPSLSTNSTATPMTTSTSSTPLPSSTTVSSLEEPDHINEISDIAPLIQMFMNHVNNISETSEVS